MSSWGLKNGEYLWGHGPVRATLVGLLAIALWSSAVGLIRGVSEHFGPTGGAALIYTAGTALLMVTIGPTRLSTVPRSYLAIGGGLFVVYEWCLSLSIGYAHSGRQAIEVGMVNYLWPTLMMTASILFNGQRCNAWIVPGIAFGMTGICWVLGGDQGFDLESILTNVRSNPLPYGLALAGSMVWAAYCTVTPRLANGSNATTLFFALTAATLWGKYLAHNQPVMIVNWSSAVHLLLAASAMALGYAAWNFGILHGNATVLAGASYFTPVLSAAFAATVLGTSLPIAFWKGAGMVVFGSLVCWYATRRVT